MAQKIFCCLFATQLKKNTLILQKRNVQVSVIGAASDIGSYVSLFLKRNSKVSKLHLYDDDDRIKGTELELSNLPGGPSVSAFIGDTNLEQAIHSSNLVVMVSRMPRKPGNTREQMLGANAPLIQRLCKAIAAQNQEAFVAISTNPINYLIPFASTVMYKYGCYNPSKMFGITHIDTSRSRSFVAKALKINAQEIQVPVIGGHSDKTIIPLFSNLTPRNYRIEPCQADMLTRLVRKAGTEVVMHKHGAESSTLAMAWSINEFIDIILDAILGYRVVVNCYTANSNFGTKFFAGPTSVGPHGIIQACCHFPMSEFESYLLNRCIPILSREVLEGEKYVEFMENVKG
ncbi:malate dehydrogenase [Bombyx mori]|uniref:Malate dehydrogenase, mitochondrial n=1 Tax=Bombyx mori TaxID=7091 RepID=A0A8R2ARD1_BOMMO|nr:malate dehydrogenase [Bombyx mori]